MMELYFQVGFGLACLVIFSYLFFELHYFGRSLLSVILAKCKKRIHILDEAAVHGICLTTDIDTLLTHMNNARFLRELDFAKIDFFERSGLFNLIKKYNGSICLGATTVRYRRFIRVFSLYKITSKIIFWDDMSIYMEHRFISNNFVSAVVICKTRIAHCNVEAMMSEALLIPENGDIEHAKREKPQVTSLLTKWIEHNEISSALLRSTEASVHQNDVQKENGVPKFTKEVNGNTNISKENIEQSYTKAVETVGCVNPTFSD